MFPPSNPFATRFIAPGARSFLVPADDNSPAYQPLDDAGFERIAGSLRRHHRGLVVGPHGSGKSTLIQSLLPTLEGRYRRIVQVRFNRDPSLSQWGRMRQYAENGRRALRFAFQSAGDSLLIVDGMEQLTTISRWLFFATLSIRGCDLLATSHHHLAGCSELYRTRMTPALIRQLATELLAESEPECGRLVWAELARRELRDVTDARSLWFELYDVAAPNLARTF